MLHIGGSSFCEASCAWQRSDQAGLVLLWRAPRLISFVGTPVHCRLFMRQSPVHAAIACSCNEAALGGGGEKVRKLPSASPAALRARTSTA